MRTRLLVAVFIVCTLAGCGPHIACGNFAGRIDECERVAEAAIPELPPGASTLTVDAGLGSGGRPPGYPAVACYPDGTAIALGVTLTADGADVRPWTEELPFACP